MRTDGRPFFRHAGVGLLRAAALRLDDVPGGWPDPADSDSCRAWLEQACARADLVDAVGLASPVLADRLNAVGSGHGLEDKQLRRLTLAMVRYVLRATARSTPFGLFAGVAPLRVGGAAQVRWGDGPRVAVRVDAQWLADVVDRLEACPELLERLEVVFSNLAVRRGGRLEVPRGPNRVTVRFTPALAAVRDWSKTPVGCGGLADRLGETFGGDGPAVRAMLTELVRQGVLITCLHPPLTVSDPLGHLLDRLREVEAETVEAVAPLLSGLREVREGLQRHNGAEVGTDELPGIPETVTERMRRISDAGRSPLAVDSAWTARCACPSTSPGRWSWRPPRCSA